MSTNEAARTTSPTSPYLDPTSIYHPARLARALGLALALLLGAALLTGGLGHPLTVNGLVAPLDGMPATSPERTSAELDRDTASHPDARRSSHPEPDQLPARPLVPVDADPATSDSPSTILLPEDTTAPAPLAPASPAPTVVPAALTQASPAAADAYSTFAQARAVAHPTAAVNRGAAVRDADTVRAGRPAAFPDGTPLLSRPSHRTGLPSTPREAAPSPRPAPDRLSPSPSSSSPKPAPLPAIPPLWETSDVLSKA